MNKHTAWNWDLHTFGSEPRCGGVPSHLIERLRNGWVAPAPPFATRISLKILGYLGIFFDE